MLCARKICMGVQVDGWVRLPARPKSRSITPERKAYDADAAAFHALAVRRLPGQVRLRRPQPRAGGAESWRKDPT